MSLTYERVAALEALGHIVAELSQMAEQLEMKRVLLFVRSGASIRLFCRDSSPLRSILVRSYAESTLGYTAQFRSTEVDLEQRLEVLRDGNQRLLLRENERTFTPSELARKLVKLIAAPPDVTAPAA